MPPESWILMRSPRCKVSSGSPWPSCSERVETDGGESERPIVSLKRGNHPEGPRGEKGTPCHDTVGGTPGGCIETLNRVHEPTTVAESGTRRIADSLREPSRSEFMM